MTVEELRLLLAALPGDDAVVVAGTHDLPHAKRLVMVTRAYADVTRAGVCVLYVEAPEPTP